MGCLLRQVEGIAAESVRTILLTTELPQSLLHPASLALSLHPCRLKATPNSLHLREEPAWSSVYAPIRALYSSVLSNPAQQQAGVTSVSEMATCTLLSDSPAT